MIKAAMPQQENRDAGSATERTGLPPGSPQQFRSRTQPSASKRRARPPQTPLPACQPTDTGGRRGEHPQRPLNVQSSFALLRLRRSLPRTAPLTEPESREHSGGKAKNRPWGLKQVTRPRDTQGQREPGAAVPCCGSESRSPARGRLQR